MRSLLFTPGDSDRKLAKGLTSDADVILIDLEDAVTAENKVSAREKTADFLRQDAARNAPMPLYVRINDLETEWAEDDLASVVPAKPAGIMLPKARSHDDVARLAGMLDALEQKAGVKPGFLSILVIAPEIPEAVLNMATFQNCDPRVAGITWGSEDLATGLAAAGSRDQDGTYRSPIELARSLCLTAGSAAGIHAIDTVYADFRDLEGLKRDAERAAADGFSGKLAIHPDQVAVINAAFTPGEEEIAKARRIVEAFDAQPGAGAINLDGAMVDMPHLQNAKKLLARAGLT
ncbi:MAG: CoA ester lyase [Hyphomicrobiaceae bacterium]|nr:CoA ester lyase [Hyphomicrobiaceae bacterium]